MKNKTKFHRNLEIRDLIKKSLERKETQKVKSGAIVVYTGKYTGRSPKDKFIVDSPLIHNQINWGEINFPISEYNFTKLYNKMNRFINQLDECFVYEGIVGADSNYEMKVKIVSEYAYQALFSRHLLRTCSSSELKSESRKLTIFCAPSCLANPKKDGTNSETFIVLNLEKMIVLIGGTKYTGEIKKAIFTVMNYLLPQKDVLPMHCSANMNIKGETALFFGLSGTGKTTLSADPTRLLIGDDEHGWSKNGVFNFEGGCYAKCINLKKKSEPQIWNAIKHGALIENVFIKNNGDLDFSSTHFTENTRVAYPLDYIEQAVIDGIGQHPKYVMFLTADAFGVLPPVAKLGIDDAIYYFLSGYTSKLAGTERGITKPKATFSTCFGAPFMPRSPRTYAKLLKEYLQRYQSKVYLVNTGWQGGPYGVGKRISIQTTRTIVGAILSGQLDNIKYQRNNMFNLFVPASITGINTSLLNPRVQWKDKQKYDISARKLAQLFAINLENYKS